mgnify:CR=1 FL=1
MLSNTHIKVLTKRELLTQVKRFLKDKNRGISSSLFADLCGIHLSTLKDVFFYQTVPLTENIQRKVSKGFIAWKNGEVAIMKNKDQTKFVEYRRQPKVRAARTTGLQMVNGEIKIKVGVINRGDYSAPTLDEQLERG